jgi:hypothetical protein
VSRSWSSFFPRLTSGNVTTTGLALARESASLAMSQEVNGVRALQAVCSTVLGVRLFDGPPPPNARAALVSALTELRAELPPEPLSLQISLADPAVNLHLLEFEEFPARRSERDALVRWRFSKMLDTEPERLVCAWQLVGRSAKHQLVLATATDRRWLHVILAACRDSKFLPTIADSNINYYFNGFHDRWPRGQHGALLVIEPANWALMLWDEEGRPRFVRSRWRDTKDDYEVILSESERQVRAYVHGEPGRDIGRVMIGGGESDALLAHLHDSDRFPNQVLDVGDCFSGRVSSAMSWQGVASAASVASLAR